MEERVNHLLNEMTEFLSCAQLKKLQEAAVKIFSEQEVRAADASNDEYMNMFLDAKSIEGCSDKTVHFYRYAIQMLFRFVQTPVRRITTEELRRFMTEYQKRNNCSKVTLNNIRRSLNSFFAWV